MKTLETVERIVWSSVAAHRRISPYVAATAVITSDLLSVERDSTVLFKCEHRQTTGSFKLRGALNKVLSVPREYLDEGVVVASTGNHGVAVAHSCRLLGGKCTVVVPTDVRRPKEKALRDLGAEIVKHGSNGLESEQFARSLSDERDVMYISPYNDLEVIIGQSTVGLEILDRIGPSFSIYVAVGGGGLISGMAAVLKNAHPGIRIVGCSPSRHPVMDESVRAGRIVDLPLRPTLSDGTAGGLEPETITLPLCSALVDDWVRVSEDEIVDSLAFLAHREKLVVEGAAAVAVAALRKDDGGQNSLAVLCGGNIDRSVLSSILSRGG